MAGRCYTSRRGAYFDGLGFRPLPSEVVRAAAALPLGEVVLTDAVVSDSLSVFCLLVSLRSCSLLSSPQ